MMKTENVSTSEEYDDDVIGLGNSVRGLIFGFAVIAFFVGLFLLVAMSTGCQTVKQVAKEVISDVVANPPSADSTADAGQPAGATASDPLVFKFGGLDGSHAVEDKNAQIKNLHMTKTGMSYAWATGGCEVFGAEDRSDYSRTSACAFYWDAAGGRWIGGRFDSISTRRTTRSFKNISDGYRKWDAAAFFAAPKRAFCIVSSDGRKRTNLLETTGP